MPILDKKTLLDRLFKEYKATHKRSAALFRKTARYEIRGGSHNLRLFDPFPFYEVSARGSQVTDVDGRTYVDFWQGHFANILGHNPKVVVTVLSKLFAGGQGLTTGYAGRLEGELAELILGQLGADKIRFTTSGTLATMYAVMLAKAFTRREMVMKVGGGWHGGQPYLLKGVTTFRGGLNELESAGLPQGIDATTVVTRFNDSQDLDEKFARYGERLACFIVEPFVGAGGFIFAHQAYLEKARELTRRCGAILIFDEVVSGFRFHPGALHTLYRIKPDLTVLGKAIGGGMPAGAVAGTEELLALCGPQAKREQRVKFDGGTFSSHPASTLAGLTYLRHLIRNAGRVYPKIGRLGAIARKGLEEIFAVHGFHVRCSGSGDSVGIASSLLGAHFLSDKIERIDSPEVAWNPEVNDIELREKFFKMAMIQEGFHIFHGYGSVSAAHTRREIQASLDAAERIARRWKKFNLPTGSR